MEAAESHRTQGVVNKRTLSTRRYSLKSCMSSFCIHHLTLATMKTFAIIVTVLAGVGLAGRFPACRRPSSECIIACPQNPCPAGHICCETTCGGRICLICRNPYALCESSRENGELIMPDTSRRSLTETCCRR
ncbi:hypothetical protein X797_003813 [Metarhizium robertsii]|uniref:Uncharacterized protein n=1 Tax=Metarhizium robertsii TaxID=568076 RepID=A0A0A1UZA1_9HYPO|nr:hypothetical protein X797_003813 [Metarhizium robertsii]